MSKRGVSKISGNSSPKVGEATTYSIIEWYPATPQAQRNAAGVTWELFKKRTNGSFTTTNIKKIGSGTFTFGEVAQRNTYRLEAYLYEPEGSGPTSIDINPQPVAVPRINKVELQYVDDSPGTVFSYTEKMRARAQCVNLSGQKLKFSLWEDDAAGDGHNANNLLIETKEATVNSSGVAVAEFMLTRALMQKAMQGETDPKQLEFYVTVEYFSNRKHATDNVNVNPVPTTRPQPRPQQSSNNSQPAQPSQPSPNNVPPRAQGSPAAEKPQSQKEEKGIVDTVTDWWNNLELWDWGESSGTIEPTQPPTQQPAGGRTVSIVQDSAVEDLLDAYFAKKEYTRQTGEAAGTFEYKIGSNGNKTSTDAEKENIAKIILAKPAVKALAAKKEYTTLETIKQALTKEVYNKDEKVTFQTFKLGAEFKKINSAPLEAKVYLVARTSGLNGKQATIIIKEKDGLIKGSAGAVLPVLEITEAQMEQTSASEEVQGTEKTEFTATIENGIAKVPVHLRPKSDDELKQWKEKVSKGKEDGEYTYKFGGENPIADESAKKRVAETILRNTINGNANNEKIADGKTAYIDDIEKALEIKTYQKDQTIKFILYKKEKELLYLQAKAQGEKQHDEEFLKADGSYFEVGKTKYIIFPTLEKPINDSGLEWEERYWAETGKDNVVCFGASRGNRKHAARDLYTDPSTTIVAIAEGKVIGKSKYFGANDVYVSILHELPDGRKFIAKYCELAKSSVSLEIGNKVRQKQELGKTAHLGVSAYNRKVKKTYSLYMCHFEIYDCSAGEDNPIYMGNNPPYMRRKDLIDPLSILEEGYRNTFGEMGDGNDHLFTINDGKEALRELYNEYKDNTWNWKWNNSDTEVQVTGKDLLTIVEKMYRLETTHFTSEQYKHCGTGGMEVFGSAPHYGWDGSLYTEQPVGKWSSFENPGLSGQGGNAQVTNKQKEFVKLPSVISGMRYKINYIIKYNGNFERWFNKTDETARSTYRTTLRGIRARFIQEIAGN